MTPLEWLEGLSYLVTIIGLPFAILVFLKEQRRERQSDDEELYLQLSDDYTKFLRLVLEHSDLHLLTRNPPLIALTPEQLERRNVLFELLVSIFERAYILVYEEHMTPHAARLWQTWADYIGEWCQRPEFRERLPVLLQGEDPEFQDYMRRVCAEPTAPEVTSLTNPTPKKSSRFLGARGSRSARPTRPLKRPTTH